MTTSMRNVVIAIVLAIGALTGVILYTSSVKQDARQEVRTVQVLVASKDIEAGTDGAAAAKLMKLKSVPVDDQVPGSIRDASGIQGLVATQTIHEGEQVVGQVFQKPIGQDAGLSLKPTERAIRVSLDTTTAAVGAVKSGDSVDIYATIKLTSSDPPLRLTRLVVPDVRVLEIPTVQTKDGKDAASSSSSTNAADTPGQAVRAEVTFAADMNDVPKIEWIAANPTFVTTWLVVRPKDAAKQDETSALQSNPTMVLGDLTPAQFQKAFGAAVVAYNGAIAAATGQPTQANGTAADTTATSGGDGITTATGQG